MSNQLYQIISKVMKVPESSLIDTMGPESIERWTSFNGYVLLHELETGFDVKFTIDEVIRNSFIVDEGDPFNEILFNKSINNIKRIGIFRFYRPVFMRIKPV